MFEYDQEAAAKVRKQLVERLASAPVEELRKAKQMMEIREHNAKVEAAKRAKKRGK